MHHKAESKADCEVQKLLFDDYSITRHYYLVLKLDKLELKIVQKKHTKILCPHSTLFDFALLLNTHPLPDPFTLESFLQISSYEIYTVL
jgi:hypothetical protein